MIAHEHFQKIKLKELVFIPIVAGIVSLFIFLNNLLFDPSLVLIISLFLLVLGMNLVVYLAKKSGTAVIFYLFTSFFTFSIGDIGILGWKKILAFVIAGILFEIIFLLLKLEIHSLPLDMIIGTSLSIASLPLVSAFLLSAGLASSFPLALINLIVLAFAVGLIASVITFLLWRKVKHTKVIIRLESYLMSLENTK